MMHNVGLNEDFIDGQITCPECGEVFFERGQICGRLRWIPTHGECDGVGARVPLEALTSQKATTESEQYHSFVAILNSL